MADYCSDHLEMVTARALADERLAQARVSDNMTRDAVERLTHRIDAIEKRLALWGGVVAALASVPLLERLVALLIPAARAAIGAP